MANFPLGDTQKVAYSLTELDADNNPTDGVAGDVIAVTSSDTASATIVPDATPAVGTVGSGFIVGGSKLQTGVVVTASVTHADGTSFLATDTIDIVAGAATQLAISLGAPVAQ